MDSHLALALDQAVRNSLDLYEQLHCRIEVGTLYHTATVLVRSRFLHPQYCIPSCNYMHRVDSSHTHRRQRTLKSGGNIANCV